MISFILITLCSVIAVQSLAPAWDRPSLSSTALILKDFKFHCYGTILTSRIVLTSTSCVKGVDPKRLYLQVDLLRPYQDYTEYTCRGKEYFVLDTIIFNITEHKENKTDLFVRDIALLFTHEIEFNENVGRALLQPLITFTGSTLSGTHSSREFTLLATSYKNTYNNSLSIALPIFKETTPNEVFIKIPEKIGTFNEGRSSNYFYKLKINVRNEKECLEKSTMCDLELQGRGSNVESILRGAPVFLSNGDLFGIVSDFYPENDHLIYTITKIHIARIWFYNVINKLANQYTYCTEVSNAVCIEYLY